MDKTKISAFADLIRKSDNIVFFGGAGVSTESGVKDYRSEDGLYNTVKQYKVSPETILSHSFFEAHPDIFYDFYYNYFLNTSAAPNRAHSALAQLEAAGKLKAVITQNIDGLHQRAGSKNVIELHGTVLKNRCPSCKTLMPVEDIRTLKGGVPRCEKCGRVIKPDVVLYEEPLNEAVISAAVRAISSADLLIIGGTSLAVYPAAGFIRYFRGENIVLINRDETQYDSMAALVFRDSIGEVMSEAMKLL
ncbi:MAG: NAD-dependent protein deacylase [Clostridia bacterium]|nr:NAD-dependent protein deacylase [Clostridia bacterium]